MPQKRKYEGGQIVPKEKPKCPRCQGDMPDYPGALSRWDNFTEICSDCGVKEALEHPTGTRWVRQYLGQPYWDRENGNAKLLEKDWDWRDYI